MEPKKVSIIIRTYNEEKNIGKVLDSLMNQTYNNFEIIIVDSESTDNTISICNKYDTKIISIKKKSFNYSYASNIGAEHAKGDILCYLSGHSIPLKMNYIERAVEEFSNERVGGIYGEALALPSGSLTEKFFYRYGYIKSRIRGKQLEQGIHPGILSCSNAFIRKDLWDKFKFKEELGKGGEDVEMAYQILKCGFEILRVPDVIVLHSHGKKFKEFIEEFKSWRIMYKEVIDYIKLNEG